MKKNAFLTFCCACIPGCGQMYQGYMKRGASLMFWFAADIAVVTLLSNLFFGGWQYALLAFLPLIWAYAFFDTFNLRNLLPEQRAAMADTFLPAAGWLSQMQGKALLRNIKLNRLLGWGLVVIGIVALYNTFWDYIYRVVWEYSPLLSEWMYRLPGFLIAVVVIVLGVRMLRSGKKRADESGYLPGPEDNDDA